MSDIEKMLEGREQIYGDFGAIAVVSQELKDLMWSCVQWSDMASFKQEALEMIIHKIARILIGDSDHKDNWRDIAGYAKLVADRL